MNDYPERVTLYDDGVYRWSYVMDMWKNRYMIRLAWKIIVPIMGLMLLFVAAMALKNADDLTRQGVAGEQLMIYLQNDLNAVYIVAGIFAGTLLLTELIYAVCALAMHGRWRLRFEMDESAVTLVRSPGSMETLNALGAVASLIALAAGKPGDALRVGSTLAVANNTGASRFEFTRRVKRVRRNDLLDLREWFGMNQIYVPPEDYDYVRDFILARIPEKARMRSQKEV